MAGRKDHLVNGLRVLPTCLPLGKAGSLKIVSINPQYLDKWQTVKTIIGYKLLF
jgi:hypothetical protein